LLAEQMGVTEKYQDLAKTSKETALALRSSFLQRLPDQELIRSLDLGFFSPSPFPFLLRCAWPKSRASL
jgi:hypothetical protein